MLPNFKLAKFTSRLQTLIRNEHGFEHNTLERTKGFVYILLRRKPTSRMGNRRY